MKKITKILSSIAISLAVATSFGCATYGPMAGTNNRPAKEDFKVLGRIEREFNLKNTAFTNLFKEAKEEYPEADDIVNLLIDKKNKRRIHVLHNVSPRHQIQPIGAENEKTACYFGSNADFRNLCFFF